MYEDAMDAVHNHLIQKSMGNKMTYTSELIPEDDENGDLYVSEPLMSQIHSQFNP